MEDYGLIGRMTDARGSRAVEGFALLRLWELDNRVRDILVGTGLEHLHV